MNKPARYGLVMIAKNEAHVIARALASAIESGVTSYLIHDTGSTDGTQEIARGMLRDLVVEVPWVNFAHNRTELLREARELLGEGGATHLLMLDADDVIEGRLPAYLDPYRAYSLPVHHSGVVHRRPQIFPVSRCWEYRGAVHEAAICSTPLADDSEARPLPLKGPIYRVVGGGARSLATASQKYGADADMLFMEHLADLTNARCVFYLAQSYRDAGGMCRARLWYQRRVEMGGWDEECFYAAYQAALLSPEETFISEMLSAWEMRPARAEPLVAVAKWCRARGRWNLGKGMAELALEIAQAGAWRKDVLFVETAAHSWSPIDEMAMATFYLGLLRIAKSLNRMLLESPVHQLPESERPRIEANLEHCNREIAAL